MDVKDIVCGQEYQLATGGFVTVSALQHNGRLLYVDRFMTHGQCWPSELSEKPHPEPIPQKHMDAADASWRKLVKVEGWKPKVLVACGIDSDGDFGLCDDDDYSIILSRRGAEQLRDWLCQQLGPPPFEGSRNLECGPVTLGCISPEARDLLERVMDEWRKHVENQEQFLPEHLWQDADDAYGFAYWLIRWSGLVRPSVCIDGSN